MKLLYRAILLLGPTGSGKSPLGEAIEKTGINGRRAIHFDFGAQLRNVVSHPEDYPLLGNDEIALIDKKLSENALLEDNEFYIAEKILISFASKVNLAPDEYVILNGLPRHLSQAEAVATLVEVVRVIHLDCTAEVVSHRITTNEGGDRTERKDDTPFEIKRKLAIFHERTAPLLHFYHQCNVPVRTVKIEKGMSLQNILNEALC